MTQRPLSVHKFSRPEMLNKRMIYVAGLPRSGATLVCQLFAQHPEIYSTGQTSPLCSTLMSLRGQLSDNDLLLNQLDTNFPLVYQRLLNAYRGFINGWFAETPKPWVVDRNRDWVRHLDVIHTLEPDFRMIICVRELSQILGAIENQHQKTVLLDFPEHLADFSRRDRATQIFSETGIVGESLRSLQSIQDVDPLVQQQLYYVVFEHLISAPAQVMAGIYQWLELAPAEVNLLQPPIPEVPSFHRFKYPQQSFSSFQTSTTYPIAPSLDQSLKQAYPWFYQTFYPGKL